VIVRRLDTRLQLITQPDHAHLAARIMEHCVPLTAHPRRDRILYAIAEHDNGWTEEDAAPTVDPGSGAIFDFVSAPVAVRHAVWPRAVSRLSDDPWAAALVAQHALTVYDRFRTEPEWQPLFARMTVMRDDMLQKSSMALADLLPDYAFVRLADLISLTFCTGWTNDQKFDRWTVHPTAAGVGVSPSAFGANPLAYEIGAKEIPNRPYRSDAELRDALGKAPTITLRGQLSA